MELLTPGLHFQEVQTNPPMEGVSTSVTGFVGVTAKGNLEEPVFITNWTQFINEFGSFNKDSYLAYAVRGYFENGGTRAYIQRVVHSEVDDLTITSTAKKAKAQIPNENPNFIVTAINEGAWGNKIQVELTEYVDPSDDSKNGNVNVEVFYGNNSVEQFTNIEPKNIEIILNDSKYIRLTVIKEDSAVTSFVKTTLENGEDGIKGLNDEDYKRGITKLEKSPINLVAVPGVTTKGVQTALLDFAEQNEKFFAILDSPMGMGVDEMRKLVTKDYNLKSEYGALYYPNGVTTDPIGVGKNPVKTIPLSGHLAGVYGNNDNTLGVWSSPAGTNAKVKGVIGLESSVSDREQSILNPNSVNCIRAMDGEGIIVWGARTLSKGEYKYINARRLVNFIKDSLEVNMLWTVFKNNDKPLWTSVTSVITSFLNNLRNQNAFKGESASECFFVKCDSENNTQDSIDAGILNVDIGLAINKPAEFVVFRISQKRNN